MGSLHAKEAGRGPPLNQFTPSPSTSDRQLRRTSFEDVETYKQILLLERLTFTPLRDWRGEVVFLGLCAMFPAEAQNTYARGEMRRRWQRLTIDDLPRLARVYQTKK